MKFTEFNLHADLQRGLDEAGYIECTGVQAQVLQNAFTGADLYVQSQTGTGKTAAYLVTILQRLISDPALAGRKALIMVPTRELAVQVEEEAKKLGKFLPFKVGSFYGGVGYAHQQKILRENAQILVGTPGRVLDLNASGQMPLMDLSFLILDEADRMFDMGFYPDLRKLIKVVPPVDRRQTMLFSATLNAYIKGLAWEYTKEPLEIEIEPEHVDVVEIEQLLYHVPSEDKLKLLLGIFRDQKPESAIIFCNTKRFTEICAKRLKMNGIDCDFIIGDLPQVKRLQIIEDIKSGRSRFLVATDVAARGLDVEGLELVVNYDLPNEAENYVHRIGRTGRAGKAGKAISLASEQDVYGLPAIEKYLGKKIPSEVSVEEQYAEDKSAGLRIHTDTYGDRDDSGRGRGGRGEGRGRDERRTGRPPRGEARPEGRSGESRRDDTRREHGEGRGNPRRETERVEARRPTAQRPEGRIPAHHAGPKGRDGGRRDEVQQAPRDNRMAARPDLSRVSFEERMAFYRQKYGNEDIQQGAKPQNGKAQAARGPRGKGATKGDSARKGQSARHSTRQNAPQKGQKKSIFGKILGIFGKK